MITRDYIINTIRTNRTKINEFGVHSIGLFGSYVRNEQSHTSDIDILIDFIPGKENFDNYMAIYDFLEELFKNETVEIITKNGLSPHIGNAILKEVIYV